MSKKLLSLLLVFLMVFSLAACGSDEPAGNEGGDTAGETYTIKIGTGYNDGHYMVNAYEAFKEYVEAESDGRIAVEIFANGSLISADADALEMVSSNTVQLTNSDYTVMGTFINDKRWESTSIPFYYGTDPAGCYTILDNAECWQQLYAELEDVAGIKLLGSVNGGSACITNATTSIDSMEAFKGLRLRTAESAPYVKPVELWGANPTPMPYGEIYTSVQQNVIDGVFTSKSAVVQSKFTEIMKYHTDVDAFLLLFGFIMNADFYNSMDAEAQAIVDAGAEVMVTAAREGEVDYRASLDEAMEADGVTIVKPEGEFAEALKEAVQPYVEERKAEIPEFMEALDAAMAELW